MNKHQLKLCLLSTVVCLSTIGSGKLLAQGGAAQGTIRNNSSWPIAIYWADDSGANQNYFDEQIPAGGSAEFQSYPGTVWRAYSGNDFISDYTATSQAGQVFQIEDWADHGESSGSLEEWRRERTLISSSIGKWQRLIFRKGAQLRPTDDYVMSGTSNSYYTLSVDEYERDRDGQGVYRQRVTTLLYCDANDVTVNRTEKTVDITMIFNGSQGAAQSTVRMSGQIRGDEDGEYVTVRFSGSGPVYSGFDSRLKDNVEGAEWFESFDTLQWKEFVDEFIPGSEEEQRHFDDIDSIHAPR
tara:strand:- start:99 stop:992 length:894 start_codon:yes stop_codon:yes gene_type:complete